MDWSVGVGELRGGKCLKMLSKCNMCDETMKPGIVWFRSPTLHNTGCKWSWKWEVLMIMRKRGDGGISDATPCNPASDLKTLSVLIEHCAEFLCVSVSLIPSIDHSDCTAQLVLRTRARLRKSLLISSSFCLFQLVTAALVTASRGLSKWGIFQPV